MRYRSTRRARAALYTSAASLLAVLSAPALAQEAGSPAPAPSAAPRNLDPADWTFNLPAAGTATPADSGQDYGRTGERLVPLAGGILPYAGNIRTFAGPVSGSAGNIRAFMGNLGASAGNIRAFAGNIRAFAGNIRAFQLATMTDAPATDAFWGKLYPANGSLVANAGNIRAFSGDFEQLAGNIRAFAGNIRAFDGTLQGYTEAASNYDGMSAGINNLISTTEAQWGTAVTAQTGKSFQDAFASKLLTKYGIDPTNPQSLVGLDEVGVELFLLDWSDNLSLYTGVDAVDHWMSAINWSPKLTQEVGTGRGSTIGLLDFSVTGDSAGNVVAADGYDNVAAIHGSAVASLMVAPHDGRGVMGIAPGASVVSYNPFDQTMTAGWADIQKGVSYLTSHGATIINMSLGIPGWTLNPGWNDVFSNDAVSKEAKKRIFVLAAGNDGIAQTSNVPWNFDKNPSIIVVGSVDPSGNISAFSNTPGTACLTRNGVCKSDSDRLMNDFIVAPGEFILVSDGQGGVTRMSGTSFAAPLVTGTIALINERWPWLRTHPQDAVEIILSSAKDLGTPGTDAVYGRGELDVAAALSPIANGKLKLKVLTGGQLQDIALDTVSQATFMEMVKTWGASDATVTAFDDTLTSYRDFLVPLSTKLLGQATGMSQDQFVAYLQSRAVDWFKAGTSFADQPASAAFAWGSQTARLTASDSVQATMTASARPYRPGLRQSQGGLYASMAFREPTRGIALRFGSGPGAQALGQPGFQLQSDYDVRTGGANPYLGLASGGGFMAMDVALGNGFKLSSGVSHDRRERDLRLVGVEDRHALAQAGDYAATATTMTLAYQPAAGVTASLGYTMLDEARGLLGMQSTDRSDLRGGSTTDALTGSLGLDVSNDLSFALSATMGRTRSGNRDRQNIAVSNGGLWTSAYQATVTKIGLFGKDRLRLSVSQPMHVESGSIDVSNVAVVDRSTGELGNVVQTFKVGGPSRRLVSEMIYGRSIADGSVQLNLFGRMNLKGQTEASEAAMTFGTAFEWHF